ncbi:hypothetical protein [Methylocystis sp.]|uniref:hypothetical protein n=1 Tax=Methylocystis sp. TaxID=1911079 RepID=UPI003D109FED
MREQRKRLDLCRFFVLKVRVALDLVGERNQCVGKIVEPREVKVVWKVAQGFQRTLYAALKAGLGLDEETRPGSARGEFDERHGRRSE